MLARRHIELAVFDLAGTTVAEGGIVYEALAAALSEAGVRFSHEELDAWHGANKIEVVRHFLGREGEGPDEAHVQKVFAAFRSAIEDAYFRPDSGIAPVPGALACFDRLRAAGIRVAVNTGYPRDIADALLARLDFGAHVDASIVSEEVGAGRPYPYMIHALLRSFGLADVRRAAKVGDTARDMEEGRNAGCGLVIGVLTGADGRDTLASAGADLVLPSVAEIEV